MADFTGTPGNDTLNGTENNDTFQASAGNDILRGAGGNDTFFGGQGNDTINGGAGSDVLDYSSLGTAVTLVRGGTVNKGSLGTDTLRTNVETVVGATGQANVIDGRSGVTASLDVNLANETLLVRGTPVGDLSFNVRNFANVLGSENSDTIVGSSGNNRLDGGGGDDIIRASRGSDNVIGGNGSDTLDYTGLGASVTLLPSGRVNKRGIGPDFIRGIETIVGDVGSGITNRIDGSSSPGAAFLNVDLRANSLTVNEVPNVGTLQFNVQNFRSVTGTNNNDTLLGSGNRDTLTGGLGNDSLRGRGDADLYVISDFGLDTISSFQTGSDKIQLGSSEFNYTFDADSIFFQDRQIATISGSPLNRGDLIFADDA
jgi:Ca2+-binding RTX toxin-like protein